MSPFLGRFIDPGASITWTTSAPPPTLPYGIPLHVIGRELDGSPYVRMTFEDITGKRYEERIRPGIKRKVTIFGVVEEHYRLPELDQWTMRGRLGDDAHGHLVFIEPQPSLAALRAYCETAVRVNVAPGCWEGIAP